MLSEIHFQKVTSSVMVCAFILLFISMLKICRVFAAADTDGRGQQTVARTTSPPHPHYHPKEHSDLSRLDMEGVCTGLS